MHGEHQKTTAMDHPIHNNIANSATAAQSTHGCTLRHPSIADRIRFLRTGQTRPGANDGASVWRLLELTAPAA
jgi:hypothetical protein